MKWQAFKVLTKLHKTPNSYLAAKIPVKMMKSAFNFILKNLFVRKIFKFLSPLFGHVEKTSWLERSGYFQNL